MGNHTFFLDGSEEHGIHLKPWDLCQIEENINTQLVLPCRRNIMVKVLNTHNNCVEKGTLEKFYGIANSHDCISEKLRF